MWKESIDRNFFILALILMIVGLNFGVLAVHSYTNPGLWKESLGFVKLRPLHVSTMLFWILTEMCIRDSQRTIDLPLHNGITNEIFPEIGNHP